jgi:hypothetical protein
MKRVLIIALVLLAFLASGTLVLAQTGVFSLPWYTIDGGAASSHGGDFALSGTVGQPDAGALSGGVFTLAGGFGGGVMPIMEQQVFLPMITR